jgi:hypothetical protein
MITNLHTLTADEYQALRFGEISSVEGTRTSVYFDTAGTPQPTIGVGFNLRDDNSLRATLRAMGMDPDLVENQ